MTEQQLRIRVVDYMRSWCGATRGSAKHREILDTYNGHKPLARGYAIQPGDAYCAATVSAAWIAAGVEGAAVLEVSVPKMMDLAKARGLWVEDDAYRPDPGDAIVYDWQDSGEGDNTGYPDHVGIVESVSGGAITVIEGNMSGGMVGRRTLAVDGRYIRGFICPDYRSLATEPGTEEEEETEEKKEEVCQVELPVLRKGMRSGYVKTLQILLNAYNRADLVADGVFGGITETAVRAYQRSRKLTVDGVAGLQTWRQLLM